MLVLVSFPETPPHHHPILRHNTMNLVTLIHPFSKRTSLYDRPPSPTDLLPQPQFAKETYDPTPPPCSLTSLFSNTGTSLLSSALNSGLMTRSFSAPIPAAT